MEHPLQITIKDLPSSEPLVQQIRDKANKLEQFCEKIQSCRVVISLAQKNQHQGKKFNVRIDLRIPRDELVINRVADENIHIALRDAFNIARRMLQSHWHAK